MEGQAVPVFVGLKSAFRVRCRPHHFYGPKMEGLSTTTRNMIFLSDPTQVFFINIVGIAGPLVTVETDFHSDYNM